MEKFSYEQESKKNQETKDTAHTNQLRWYWTTPFIIAAFLCVGPLALPLVIFHPTYRLRTKLVISGIVLVSSYFLWKGTALLLSQLTAYYSLLFPQS